MAIISTVGKGYSPKRSTIIPVDNFAGMVTPQPTVQAFHDYHLKPASSGITGLGSASAGMNMGQLATIKAVPQGTAEPSVNGTGIAGNVPGMTIPSHLKG